MKLILIIVLSCTFAGVCFAAGGISKDEFNLIVAPIKELIDSGQFYKAGSQLLDAYRTVGRRGRPYIKRLNNLKRYLKNKRERADILPKVAHIGGLMRSDEKLDEAFFKLANLYKYLRRDQYTYIRMLDNLTKNRRKVTEKLQVESQSLDEYIIQVLHEWIENNGDEKKIQFDEIGVEFERQLETHDPHVDQVPDLISNILDQSKLCSLFVDPYNLQGEAAKFAINAFLLEEMSLRDVHPGPLTDQGQHLAKLRAYCNFVKPQPKRSFLSVLWPGKL